MPLSSYKPKKRRSPYDKLNRNLMTKEELKARKLYMEEFSIRMKEAKGDRYDYMPRPNNITFIPPSNFISRETNA